MDRLTYLENSLARLGWIIVQKSEGDDCDVTQRWIARKPGRPDVELEMEGMDELSVLPVEQSYGVRSRTYSISEYISGKKQPRERRIDHFVERLDGMAR